MVSDFGYEIKDWDDFLELLAYKNVEDWSRLALITRHPMGAGYSCPGHGEFVFVFGLFLGLVPRTLDNMCYIIDELPAYLVADLRRCNRQLVQKPQGELNAD